MHDRVAVAVDGWYGVTLRQRGGGCRALAWLAGLLLVGCSGSDPEPGTAAQPAPELPAEVVVEAPDAPILDLNVVEDSSEAVANALVALADKLRRRDFHAARAWFAEDFAGHALAGLPFEEEELPLGTRKRNADVSSPRVVDGAGFLASLTEIIGPWSNIEWVTTKVKAGEFQSGLPAWGRVRQKWSIIGRGPDGGPRSLVVWAWTRVEKVAGRWVLTRFALESLSVTSREHALFTDVATSAGVAHAGIRFGRPGNQSFAWNGAAAGDVNGDGRVDLFVPSSPENFLYVARAEGGFNDEAAVRGVQHPAGGTGVVFLDFDNDGDQDLALADVGWEAGDDVGGNALRLWVNDGKGHFVERGHELGFGDPCDGYSLTVLDADGDGWLDLYVCNYGRVEVDPNNSWIQATNGSQDRFYRNLEGRGFHEEAQERGLTDTGWSYAAAAADFDLDGDTDLYVANDYGVNALWVNDGSGHFVDRAEALGVSDLGNGMGVSWGDLDADGSLDLYVSNMSSTAGRRILARMTQKDDSWQGLSKMAAGNSIFMNRGDTFERVSTMQGGIGGSWAWSPALFDLDNDGSVDVYCCSGYVTGDTAADT